MYLAMDTFSITSSYVRIGYTSFKAIRFSPLISTTIRPLRIPFTSLQTTKTGNENGTCVVVLSDFPSLPSLLTVSTITWRSRGLHFLRMKLYQSGRKSTVIHSLMGMSANPLSINTSSYSSRRTIRRFAPPGSSLSAYTDTPVRCLMPSYDVHLGRSFICSFFSGSCRAKSCTCPFIAYMDASRAMEDRCPTR